MKKSRIALITVNETRERFKEIRKLLVEEECKSLDWITGFAEVLKSEPLSTGEAVKAFMQKVDIFNPHLLVIHIPIWTEPVLAVKAVLAGRGVPVVLIGNQRKETSSMVGLFGAGGSLDQAGLDHIRLFDHHLPEERRRLQQIAAAAAAVKEMKGMTYGCFGGRSLGMVTATADTAQWLSIFGVDTEHIDQYEIVKEAERVDPAEIDIYVEWLKNSCMKYSYNELFNEEALRKQAASYLATKKIIDEKHLDFIGVKCQPELSDNFTTQCVSHMICNGSVDPDGFKKPVVHACEADADGALTMQIMHLLSDEKPAALLDMRWRNPEDGIWTLANCGAFASDFGATESDPTGLSSVEITPHVIGEAGGCGLPMMASAGEVTMARLCRKNGRYFMFIVEAEILEKPHEDLKEATAAFPQAYMKMATDSEFFESFGSNHMHMVKGNICGELELYCTMTGIDYKTWVKD